MAKKRYLLRAFWSDQSGNSLLEVTVAIVLLLTVLIPLGSFAVYFAGKRLNEREITALALGRQYMEDTLHERTYISGTYRLDEDRWLVEKEVDQRAGRILISIKVYRTNDTSPLVELSTMRLVL